jgi:hypothetical protein
MLTLTLVNRGQRSPQGGLRAAYFSRCGVVDLTLMCDLVMRLYGWSPWAGLRLAEDPPSGRALTASLSSSQRNQVLLDSFPGAWLEVGGRDQVDAGAEDGF